MGGIKVAFHEYLAKWSTADGIQKSAATFMRETKGIIQVLGKRLQAEDGFLYDLADKAE